MKPQHENHKKIPKVSFGSWIQIGHPAVAELMASIGFDWLAVDLEHGAIDISQCLSLVQAIKGQGVIPLAHKSRDSYIDLSPRLKPKASDHTVLVAEFEV